MSGWDKVVLLKHLLEQRLSKTAIARRLGVSRRIVYHWIASGQLERDLSAPPPVRTAAPCATKLDPYKPVITQHLDSYPALSAVHLFTQIKAAGTPAASPRCATTPWSRARGRSRSRRTGSRRCPGTRCRSTSPG